MNINLIPLNTKGRVDFDFIADLSNYKSEDILRCDNIHVIGYILDNGTDDYEINLTITGNVITRSAINLSEVIVPIDIKYDDFIKNLVSIYKNSANTLDILPIIWENILLEIPIRATNSSDAYENMSGDGWEIVSE